MKASSVEEKTRFRWYFVDGLDAKLLRKGCKSGEQTIDVGYLGNILATFLFGLLEIKIAICSSILVAFDEIPLRVYAFEFGSL